jgi:ABC-type antimicrobial peptide transport system permease subunit
VIPLSYSGRSLWAHRVSTSLSVLGLALVVFVFSAVLAMARGIRQALASSGDPVNVIALRDGATSEITSSVEREALRTLSTAPELALSARGEPLFAGEWLVLVSLGGLDRLTNITLRGIQPNALALRPSVRMEQGRLLRAGTNEVVIGAGLAGRFEGASLGGELAFAGQRWPVVGVFSAEGSSFESEVWADGERVGAVFERPSYSSLLFRIASGAQVDDFIQRVDRERRLRIKARRENQYWEEQSRGLATFVRVLGFFVALVFSTGAGLGAMITMYAQVAARVRELATLRALGFRRSSVLGAVLVESCGLGLLGGLLGAAASLALRLVEFRTLNFQTFSEVRFQFSPTPSILALSVLFGVVLGLGGGIMPAIRAARLSILEAVRS